MALDDASVDKVLDRWVDAFEPPIPPDGREAVKRGSMRHLVRIIFEVLKEDAVVGPGTMTADGEPVVGEGEIA